ncbi:malonate decarboxylase holo-[acyl-carrier-protein] synthase [Rhodoferax ferrireducens]|uniref:malonate decarboxylase holo-[acyl-carrier-protein] synthase n=1 Tax=Rhodoferax ferrireducens TaxID=192843 RepID=UPI000E0CE6C7|nr:malonate decarboxylase holo-[acyl-carrier-protein] synthase [Rhodoferax ferrireducens]
MKRLARNQLVRIDTLAWQQIEARAWDPQAQEILAHWRAHSLPLVVCRQRDDASPDQICLGLPAPMQWSRRRLALRVPLDQIQVSGFFPSFLQVARASHWGLAAMDFDSALSSLGVNTRVYGSHGWQFLTDLPYLHDESDIDLSLHVDDFEAARRVVQQLATTELHRRIDGEIVFPTGEAIAWRELQKLLAGQTTQVMVKARCSIRLAAMEEVSQLGWGTHRLTPKTALALN